MGITTRDAIPPQAWAGLRSARNAVDANVVYGDLDDKLGALRGSGAASPDLQGSAAGQA